MRGVIPPSLTKSCIHFPTTRSRARPTHALQPVPSRRDLSCSEPMCRAPDQGPEGRRRRGASSRNHSGRLWVADSHRVTGRRRKRPPRAADRGLGPGPVNPGTRRAAPPLPHPPARPRLTTKPRLSLGGRRRPRGIPSPRSPPRSRHPASPLPSSTSPCPKAQPPQARSQLQPSTRTAKGRSPTRMEAAAKWLRPRHPGGGASGPRLRRRAAPEPTRPERGGAAATSGRQS